MYSLIFLGIVSFVLSSILTPLIRDAFRRCGIMDHPDAERKAHDRALPRVGGVPLIVSYLCSFGLLVLASLHGSNLVHEAVPFARLLLPSAVMIFTIGLVDDLMGLKPWQKLAGQIVVAGAAYWAGVRIEAFGAHVFIGWWSLPLTLVWLVLCTNAVNLIDGVDGLATGVGLFAAATMLLAALLHNNFGLAAATMPLVGALLGFLRYNFNPATIFLGDSGSLLLGFLLGCYGVMWSQKAATILGMTAPLMALSIPLLDTALAIVRRFLRSKSIFTADHGHIHHRLLDRGLTPRKVALVFYGLCSIAAVFSLCITSQHFEGLVLVLFCAAAWIGIQHLGYVELGVAGRMFMEGAFRRLLSSQIALQSHQQRLITATTPEECWTIIENAGRELGIHSIRMVLGSRIFQYECGNEPLRILAMRLPLSEVASMELAVAFGERGRTGVMASFAEMVGDTLAAKLVIFGTEPATEICSDIEARVLESAAGEEKAAAMTPTDVGCVA